MPRGSKAGWAIVLAVTVLATGGVAGCDEGGGIGRPGSVAGAAGDDSKPNGAAAAPADATAACRLVTRSGKDLVPPSSSAEPWVGGERLSGAYGLAYAAAQANPRFAPLKTAMEKINSDIRALNTDGLAATSVPAALAACRDLGLPAEPVRAPGAGPTRWPPAPRQAAAGISSR